jgi:hypothetical protein
MQLPQSSVRLAAVCNAAWSIAIVQQKNSTIVGLSHGR